MTPKILHIAGDASFRKFYRIILKKEKRIIIFAKREKYKNLLVYSTINNFLKSRKILTPKLYSQNYKKGLMVIEDFGEVSYRDILLTQKKKLPTYKRLVDLLIKIQKIKPKRKIKFLKKSYLMKKYSIKNLKKESDLFFDWYLPFFYNKKKILSLKKKMNKILISLYKKLNFPNTYFVHRDFHAENLMKTKKGIGVIDTQDALIGNPSYDLVSLIDDVRIKTSQNLKQKIFNYYLKENTKFKKINKEEFEDDFNVLSVQRSLKIIGIFARLLKRDKKSKYFKMIPYTWKILESRVNSKIFADLKNIIDSNIKNNIRKKILYKWK